MGDLIRGSDRKWFMNWDESKEGDTQDYIISFDMNHNTVMVRNGLVGDVNGDGKVDIADAQFILIEIADGKNNPVSDFNGDGKVDVADVVAIVNKMLGKPAGSFNFTNADINGDGQITDSDVDAVNAIIFSQTGQK